MTGADDFLLPCDFCRNSLFYRGVCQVRPSGPARTMCPLHKAIWICGIIFESAAHKIRVTQIGWLCDNTYTRGRQLLSTPDVFKDYALRLHSLTDSVHVDRFYGKLLAIRPKKASKGRKTR